MKVKQWLEQRDVVFEEVRIDQDIEAMLSMVERTAQTSVPCTIIESAKGEDIIFGFDEARLASATGVSA